MPPVFYLVRSPSDVDAWDADAVRASLMESVRQEVQLKSQPHPRIVLVGDGFVETFDLDAMAKGDPAASAGATFQALRDRPNIHRRFVILQMIGDDTQTGVEKRFAVLFEEIDDVVERERRWWMALLEYHVDSTTGLGVPGPAWQQSQGETNNPANLWPFLQELAAPRPGARAARVLPPRLQQPDIRTAIMELPADVPEPSDSLELVELTGRLAAGDLLAARLKGVVVIKVYGRAYETWILGDGQPASLEDMMRYIANERPPAASGMALAQIAIRPEDEPAVPGLQMIAEMNGEFCEAWGPIEFPEGPKGPKHVTALMRKGPLRVPDGGMWLGVDPMVAFELTPLGAAEA